jgi:hypothetical protein
LTGSLAQEGALGEEPKAAAVMPGLATLTQLGVQLRGSTGAHVYVMRPSDRHQQLAVLAFCRT